MNGKDERRVSTAVDNMSLQWPPVPSLWLHETLGQVCQSVNNAVSTGSGMMETEDPPLCIHDIFAGDYPPHVYVDDVCPEPNGNITCVFTVQYEGNAGALLETELDFNQVQYPPVLRSCDTFQQHFPVWSHRIPVFFEVLLRSFKLTCEVHFGVNGSNLTELDVSIDDSSVDFAFDIRSHLEYDLYRRRYATEKGEHGRVPAEASSKPKRRRVLSSVERAVVDGVEEVVTEMLQTEIKTALKTSVPKLLHMVTPSIKWTPKKGIPKQPPNEGVWVSGRRMR